MQHLTKEKLRKRNADRSESSFLEDPSVPELFRSTNKDYAYVMATVMRIVNSIESICCI